MQAGFVTRASSAARAGTSGNPLADKRFAYAEALVAEGDDVAAADLFAQALEMAPAWAAAHLALGQALERLGDANGARAAYAAAATHDPSGSLGAALHRDRLDGVTPPGMSQAYVAGLFDQYAARFDAHLVNTLGYRGPQAIMEALREAGADQPRSPVLDLGCGTGLMARALGQPDLVIDGIDLSAAMLAEARAIGLYRSLWQGDCEAMAATLPRQGYGLALAADVLVYLGDLEALFRTVAQRLAPGGLFAATVQAQAEPHPNYSLGPELRFRHAPHYIRDRLDASGLAPQILAPCVTRHEAGTAVPGLVFVARRS